MSYEWRSTEVAILKENWDLYYYIKDLMPLLPGRTCAAIRRKGWLLGLTYKGRQRVGYPMFALLIWWEVQKRPGTVYELAKRVGCCRRESQRVISAFAEAGVVYEQTWVKRPHKWTAVWAAGEGVRRKCPQPTGRARECTPHTYIGNPFRDLLIEADRVDTECTEDVHT